jgi:phenylalanine-4-hydroxylase
MGQGATLYSPAITRERGKVRVVFAPGHPGLDDLAYRDHRARIAEHALEYRPGRPIPEIDYTEAEHELWRTVSKELRDKHEGHACAEYLRGAERLNLPADRLPQLGEVSASLEKHTGFRFAPAAGLVDITDFYGSLADRLFQATQYIRHCSMPFFSPEPDMLHEIVGHGCALADDRLADLYELVGHTARRLRSRDALAVVSRMFWFVLEYGLVMEGGRPRALGASTLSSSGELDRFASAEIRPLDVDVMIAEEHRVDHYQPVLYCAESFGHLEDFLSEFLTTIDDGARLPNAG